MPISVANEKQRVNNQEYEKHVDILKPPTNCTSASTIRNTVICVNGISRSQPRTWKRNYVESLQQQEDIKKLMKTTRLSNGASLS